MGGQERGGLGDQEDLHNQQLLQAVDQKDQMEEKLPRPLVRDKLQHQPYLSRVDEVQPK